MSRRLHAVSLLLPFATLAVGCRSGRSLVGEARVQPAAVPALRRDVVPPAIARRDSQRDLRRHLARYGLGGHGPSSIARNGRTDPGTTVVSDAHTPGQTVRQVAHVFPKRPDAAQPDGPPTVPPAPAKTKDNPEPGTLPPMPAPQSAGSASVDGAQQIDLSTSLALVAGQNPQVGFVQQRVQEACARLDAADALWLPSLRGGLSYNKHEGSIQNSAGRVFNVSRGSAYTGFGAQAVGTGSPAVSGLYARFHLADAIFQPLIAERTVSARQYEVSATTNNLLLQAALAYVDLELAVQRNRVAGETLAELKKLAELTASFAKRGQAPQADADRAQTELELQKNNVTRSVEAIQKASSRLAEVLSLDHDLELRPAGMAFTPAVLVDVSTGLESLIEQGVTGRPEMSQYLMEISAAANRYQRERYSPLVPNVGAGMSWGGFGGGTGDTIAHYRDRLDLDAWVYWEVRNLGLGERAARNAASARVQQARFLRARLENRIRREVKDGFAELLSATKQIEQAQASAKTAAESYAKNSRRIRNARGLPIEVLQSIRALDAAKRETINARAAWSRAQFRLHHAIGWPSQR